MPIYEYIIQHKKTGRLKDICGHSLDAAFFNSHLDKLDYYVISYEILECPAASGRT